MKKNFLLLALLFAVIACNSVIYAQEEKPEGYIFTKQKEVKYTPVKDQNRSGTCWSYSGVGFLECELLRKGKGEYDLADMWIVNKAYSDKADIYVRMHGHYNFGGGGAFIDVFRMIEKYGIMPEEAYPGNHYGTELPVHGELDAILKAYVDAVLKNGNKKLSSAWKKGYDAVLSAYLGEKPEKFDYKGVSYPSLIHI